MRGCVHDCICHDGTCANLLSKNIGKCMFSASFGGNFSLPNAGNCFKVLGRNVLP